MRAELLFGALERKAGRPEEAASSAAYLQQPLQYGEGGDGAKVLMDDEQAVMMAWELPLMEAHANVVCTGRGDVLNIGFGLGIIDEVSDFMSLPFLRTENLHYDISWRPQNNAKIPAVILIILFMSSISVLITRSCVLAIASDAVCI